MCIDRIPLVRYAQVHYEQGRSRPKASNVFFYAVGCAMAEMVRVEHLEKNFGDLEVLRDINLTVAEGEKLVIIGPSGSGKSTFIRCSTIWKSRPPARSMWQASW